LEALPLLLHKLQNFKAMKKIVFTVELEFDEKITSDEDIKTVAENVADAITISCDHGTGIAPQDSENFLVGVSVSSDVLEVEATRREWWK